MDKLLSFNDLSWDDKVQANSKMYIQPKKSKGPVKTYVVKSGDTMYSISQEMGIRLASLYRRNKMRVGEQPKAGATLFLKGSKK